MYEKILYFRNRFARNVFGITLALIAMCYFRGEIDYFKPLFIFFLIVGLIWLAIAFRLHKKLDKISIESNTAVDSQYEKTDRMFSIAIAVTVLLSLRFPQFSTASTVVSVLLVTGYSYFLYSELK